MKWSFKIARIAGIDVRMHATFFLLLAWVALVQYFSRRELLAAFYGIVFIIAVFFTIVLHELGHALAARRFGIRTREITLLPIGGVSRLERIPDNPRQELWISLAGPLVSLAVALALFLLLLLGQASGALPPVAFGELRLGPRTFLANLMWVNVALAVFNLLPAFPMDGGRVLRALLALRMPHASATHVAGRIGQGMALALGLIGLFTSPILVIIALFVWIGASQESAAARLRSGLEGIPVQAAMETEFRTLAPDDPLAHAVELVMAGSQQDFPVVAGGHVAGVLTRGGLLRGLAEKGPQQPVSSSMDSEIVTADPSEMLSDALARLGDHECRTVPVVRDDRLIGILTPENVGDFVSIQAAMSSKNGPDRPASARKKGACVGQELRGDQS